MLVLLQERFEGERETICFGIKFYRLTVIMNSNEIYRSVDSDR